MTSAPQLMFPVGSQNPARDREHAGIEGHIMNVKLVHDQKLVTWAHEALVQLLDCDLLPVYLDVLQIVKSKVRCMQCI